MRTTPIQLKKEEFRAIGHELIDTLADLLANLDELPVAVDQEPADIRRLLPQELPETGGDAGLLIREAARVLIDRSTFTSHPQFYGYINGSVAPIGILGDLLASAINPNVGGWALSPVATEIEKQAVRWICELIGYPASGAGLFVSGGNMANMVGFLAARAAQTDADVRTKGLAEVAPKLTAYVSHETHTWVQKAADLFGLGTDSIRWIGTDDQSRIDVAELRRRITEDRASGRQPFCVVGTAGTVSTGAVDPIRELRAVCDEFKLWLHVDGAYGAPAAALENAHEDLKALATADSVAVDPHKWLYVPFEAGCALVRDEAALINAFLYRPAYYHFEGKEDDPRTSFYEMGLQNTRGFRALKVWLAIRHVGRRGYQQMIGDDIALSQLLFAEAEKHPELEAVTQGLSITTFRYVPHELRERAAEPDIAKYLNDLNTAILSHLQTGGEVFVSNAVVNDVYVLRACITNWRTTEKHVRAVPGIVARVGKQLHAHMGRQVLVTGR
ncbi:MAG TPA: aspartate aminotransferase family protein [Longimicrobiales bacterium]